MRILSNFEVVSISGGMGRGPAAGQNSSSPVNKGNGSTSVSNGVIGGAVAGFLGSLATSTPIGALGVMAGGILGGFIAGGGLTPGGSNGGVASVSGGPTSSNGYGNGNGATGPGYSGAGIGGNVSAGSSGSSHFG